MPPCRNPVSESVSKTDARKGVEVQFLSVVPILIDVKCHKSRSGKTSKDNEVPSLSDDLFFECDISLVAELELAKFRAGFRLSHIAPF